MPRADGFPRADVDVGFMHDPKVVALARYLHDESATSIAVTLYFSLVLKSWQTGHRATLDEAQPAWSMSPVNGVREALERCGLVDAEGCIPAEPGENWFGPARDRREEWRERGRRGGVASAAARGEKRPDGQAHG